MKTKWLAIGIIGILLMALFIGGCVEETKKKKQMELTVNSHGWYDYSKGGKYGVEVTLKNIGDETITMLFVVYSIYSSDGTWYDWDSESDDAPSQIEPGSSATWFIYFDVQKEKTYEKIAFEGPDERVEAGLANFKNEEKPNIWQLTVNNHDRYNNSDDYYDGYYMVDITLKNIGSETEYVYDFKLYATDGTGYIEAGDDGNEPYSLAPGASGTWTVYFDMPEDKTAQKLVYNEGDLRTETEITLS